MRQTMPLYDYFTPKLNFKHKFNHRQSFLYKGRLTVLTIRKFRTGSSIRIESQMGSSIRTRIESRSFAGHCRNENPTLNTQTDTNCDRHLKVILIRELHTFVRPAAQIIKHALPKTS